MELDTQVLQRAEEFMSQEDRIGQLELPAVRVLMFQIAEAGRSPFAYTKHSAHTKTSTKGCVMGCLGG